MRVPARVETSALSGSNDHAQARHHARSRSSAVGCRFSDLSCRCGNARRSVRPSDGHRRSRPNRSDPLPTRLVASSLPAPRWLLPARFHRRAAGLHWSEISWRIPRRFPGWFPGRIPRRPAVSLRSLPTFARSRPDESTDGRSQDAHLILNSSTSRDRASNAMGVDDRADETCAGVRQRQSTRLVDVAQQEKSGHRETVGQFGGGWFGGCGLAQETR